MVSFAHGHQETSTSLHAACKVASVSCRAQLANSLAASDEEFDDEELLELAQAGRSQQDQADVQPTREQPADTSSPPSSPTQAEAQNMLEQPGPSDRQAVPGTDRQTSEPAAVPDDGYLELDDDELLEMACATMDTQQDGAASVLATAVNPDPGPVPDTKHAGYETKGETCQKRQQDQPQHIMVHPCRSSHAELWKAGVWAGHLFHWKCMSL